MKRSLERKVQKAIKAANEVLVEQTGNHGREPRLVVTAVSVQAVMNIDGMPEPLGSPVTVLAIGKL